MKQSAVQWLVDNLSTISYIEFYEEIEKAKEIEKEQIIDAYSEGDINGIMDNRKMAEQYYNETFNK